METFSIYLYEINENIKTFPRFGTLDVTSNSFFVLHFCMNVSEDQLNILFLYNEYLLGQRIKCRS